MTTVPQLFLRQPKTVSLFQAEPIFKDLPNFIQPDSTQDTRCAQYILNGKLFLYTLPSGIQLIDTVTGNNVLFLPIIDVFEINVSPLGNYITTWSKLSKNETGENYLPNVNIINIFNEDDTFKFKILHSFLNKTQNGWIPQFTADESIVAFLKNPYSINFFKLQNFDFSKPFSNLDLKNFGKIENFQISPGKNPSISIFLPAVNSNPAFIKIYSLSNLKNPVSEKQFFKGEECEFKWNSLGTSILALVSTDIDSTNKSYYGETQLYLLDISGLFVQKISLGEGPIHEITWSPTSREFAVIHGFMPATTTFFDSRGNSIHSLPKAARNTILYSPHAKFILVAGFGNLPGDIDILDRQNKFNKIISFNASNTSVCKWSPDGRFILTATTSPRLRVDNSIKIWYFNGTLMYYKKFNELNSVSWKFQPLSDFPPITVSKFDKLDCDQDKSAIDYLNNEKNNKIINKKSTGAYRPPHARNKLGNNNTGRSLADLHELTQNGSKPKSFIPGYNPKDKEDNDSSNLSKTALRNRRKRANKRENDSTSNSTSTSNSNTPPPQSANSTPSSQSNPDLIIGGVFSIEEKKIRNLLKKLRAIESLKIKQSNGDFLEDTQILKISTEDSVRKELESLGWKEDEQ